jgi:hypothetical protein
MCSVEKVTRFIFSALPDDAAKVCPGNDDAVGQWDSDDEVRTAMYFVQNEVYALQVTSDQGFSDKGLLLEHCGGNRYQKIGYFDCAKSDLFEGSALSDIILI